LLAKCATDAYVMAKNDLVIAERLVKDYPTVVNVQDERGRTVLHMAVEEEQEKVARGYVWLFCGIIERQDDATLLACWEAYSANRAKSEQGTLSMIQGVFFVPEAGGEKKMNRKQAVYHTALTIAAAKNFDKVVQDLLGIVLASTSTRSRLYVTVSLPLLVKEYPKHVTAFLNALELDRASDHVEYWRQELGGRYKVRCNRSSFAFSKAAWGLTEDEDEDGSGVTSAQWARVAWQSILVLNSNYLPVVPKVVGLEGVATNTALLNALCESKHLDLFETKVVQALLKWKWQHHGWGMCTQRSLPCTCCSCSSTRCGYTASTHDMRTGYRRTTAAT
jgi:hypothetical protein